MLYVLHDSVGYQGIVNDNILSMCMWISKIKIGNSFKAQISNLIRNLQTRIERNLQITEV